ncbi:MAG: hypothetical protein ACREIV_10170, partial [Planctomycetaceae bacterium]
YKQVEFRPDSPEGNLEPEPWLRQLTIKSVVEDQTLQQVREQALQEAGIQGPARWIEIVVVTGHLGEGANEGVIDAGPGGTRKYLVLIEEAKIIGRLVDDQNIPVAMIPILKGYRQIGTAGEVQEIASKVLDVYPVLTLLQHYRVMTPETGQPQTVDIPLGSFPAMQYTATQKIESPSTRSTNVASLWRTDPAALPDAAQRVPFGLAKWTVKVTLETKDSAASRSEFTPASEFSTTMQAAEAGQDAQRELVLPGE